MSATGRSDVRDPDDYYKTPAWCTEAILPFLGRGAVLDPCAGEGAILDVVRRSAERAHQDIYGLEIDRDRASRSGALCCDALSPLGVQRWQGDLVITNPPYRLASEFVLTFLVWSAGQKDGAFLLRLNWLASQKRASFHKRYPCDVFVLPRRPSFTGKGTDATEYCWMVWGPGRGNRWHILDV